MVRDIARRYPTGKFVLVSCYGNAAGVAEAGVVRKSQPRCNYMTQDVCFTVVTAIHGNVEAFVEEYFAEKHADLYPQVLSALELYRQQHLPKE